MGHDGLEEGESAFADVVEVSFVFEAQNLFVVEQFLHIIWGRQRNGFVGFVNNAAVDVHQ